MRLVGSITHRLNAASGRTPAQLYDFGASLDLTGEICDRALGEEFDQGVKAFSVAIRPAFYAPKVPARSAFHHIDGNGPGRTGEPNEGRSRTERRTHAGHRLQHRLQPWK